MLIISLKGKNLTNTVLQLSSISKVVLFLKKSQSKFCPFNHTYNTPAWDFLVLVFCLKQTYIGQLRRLLRDFDVIVKFAEIFKIFIIHHRLS
jgi:hypothetical protein